jgi:hypothetical protein
VRRGSQDRLRVMARSPLRVFVAQRVAEFLAGGLADRQSLEILVDVEDMPNGGWSLKRENLWRVGVDARSGAGKRAREAKLIGAHREFTHPDGSNVIAQVTPFTSHDDALSALEGIWQRLPASWDITAERTDEVEVPPPDAAGDHARALLIGRTSRNGDWRTLCVSWVEHRVWFVIRWRSPAEVDLWEPMSVLVEQQRHRSARFAAPVD